MDLWCRRLSADTVKDLILAIASTVEGDAAIRVIHRMASERGIKLARIAYGRARRRPP